jgi:hypothetical protein
MSWVTNSFFQGIFLLAQVLEEAATAATAA